MKTLDDIVLLAFYEWMVNDTIVGYRIAENGVVTYYRNVEWPE